MAFLGWKADSADSACCLRSQMVNGHNGGRPSARKPCRHCLAVRTLPTSVKKEETHWLKEPDVSLTRG
eukprot:1156808-Pelagomonas_calceolata.AAC.3